MRVLLFLLIGAFAGAVLGILSNWATNENFTITRFSIVLMIFMLVLTTACLFWVRIIRRRADALKKQMLSRKNVLTEQTSLSTARKVQ